MNNYTAKAAALLLALSLLTGCGAEDPKTDDSTPAPQQTEETQEPAAAASAENPMASWLPEGTVLTLSESEHLPELAEAIARTYDIPEESWADTRYYYNYVDLNEDGSEEIFAVVMGMYTSGTGGDSGLLLLPYAGMTVSQQFTLLRAPILVSDAMTGGAHDLIYLRSGGGSEPALVRLTCTDGVYTNPADAEVLPDLNGITGTAILGNDPMADMEAGEGLTLAGPANG